MAQAPTTAQTTPPSDPASAVYLLQSKFDEGADADTLVKLADDLFKQGQIGAPVDPNNVAAMVKFRDEGGKGAGFLPSALPGQELGTKVPATGPAETFAGVNPVSAAISAAGDVFAAEPSLGLDPERRAALENMGALGQYLYAPVADVGALLGTTTTAALTGLGTGAGQFLENVGVLPAITALTGVRETPERFSEQLLGLADFATMKYPTVAMPRIAEVAAPVTAPPTRLARRPRVAAPEVPPAAVTPEISPAMAAATEVPPSVVTPPNIPGAATIPVTQENVARAAKTLENLAAPADEAAAVTDKIGNINVAKLDATDDVKRVIDEVSKTNDAFIEARRGVVPIDEINRLADKVDLEDIIGRKIGQPFNAEQITAARRAVVASADDLFETARQYVASGDQNLRQKALEAVMRQAAFQEQVAGATAELGRAMRSLREVQGSDRSRALETIVGQYTDMTDPRQIDDFLNKISTLNSPEAVSKFVGESVKPGFGDKITELWINGLLAGPTTHAVNVTSNAIFSALSVPEKALASVYGKVLRSSDRITSGEVGARIVGMLQGAKDGTKLFAQAIKTGEAASAKTAIEQQRKAISGVKGELVRVPSRLLTAEDELFKSINSRGELAAQAYAKAANEAGSDAAKRAELYKQYLENPTPDMKKAAERQAELMTFQNDLGKWGRKTQDFVNTVWPLRFVVPFIRTPVNIIKQGLGRTPLAPLATSFWRDVKAGGRVRDEALARVTLGSAVAGSIAAFAEAGLVTGNGPSDPAQRAALLATGWQPQSFKIGDKYYAYGRLEPLALQLGLAADFATQRDYMTKKESDNVATAITLAIAKNLASKTYLQGISDMMEAFSDTDRYGERYVLRMASSFVPNILPQTASAIDPVLRDTTAETFAGELLNNVKARVPGLSDNLPTRRDPWGDPITRTGLSAEGGVGGTAYNLLSPVRVSRENVSSPAKTEAAKIMFLAGKPDKKVTINGQSYDIPEDLHRRYSYASGATAKMILDNMVKQPAYQRLDDETKRKVFRKVFEETRDYYRDGVKYEVYQTLLRQQQGAQQ